MRAIINGLNNWLDNRTGYRELLRETLYENIPGGSRWIYITGSMLVFAFVTQMITGIFLAMFYSAGSQNAWESVYMIQHEVQGGWLLRGVHHSMAQGMVVLLPLHLIQVVVCRAYVAPREINYWLGLVLMLITLGLGLTGYLLPWDQKGYWATKVATELAALTPVFGAQVQKLAVGGAEYGHYTLTRFFTLHVMVLPGLLLLVLGAHVAMFRKHGITAKSSERRPDEYFWPKQVFKDAVGCLVLLAAVVGFVIWEGGAELGPPAEPTEAYGAARPEWYYLFLFQLLKHAPTEFIGAIVIPGAVMAFLFILPIVGRVSYGHVMNVAVLFVLVGCAGYLTYEAISHDDFANSGAAEPTDKNERLLYLERMKGSEDFLLAQHMAELEAERAVELVQFYGIPKQGAAVSIIKNDPEIQGPRIFMKKCASCHSYTDDRGTEDTHDDLVIPGPRPPRDADGLLEKNPAPYGAPDLGGFASQAWIQGMLTPEGIISDKYFGRTAHGVQDEDGAWKSSGMVEFVHDNLADLSDEEKAALNDAAAALAAQAGLVDDPIDAQQVERGMTAMSDFGCFDCHKLGDEGDLGVAPDLTGYGSAAWLDDFIANPSHERFYFAEPGEASGNDRMPAFAEFKDESKNKLSNHERRMLVRWIRGDDRHLGKAEAAHVTADETTPAAEPVNEPVNEPADEPAGEPAGDESS